MPIAIAGTPTTYDNAGGAGNATLTLPAPAGIVAGELLIAWLALGGTSGSVTAVPAGWTLLQGLTDNGNALGGTTSSIQGALYYKIATASEPSSYTWTTSAAGTKNVCTMFRVSGATASPFRVSATNRGLLATSWTAPALTGVQSTDVQLNFWAVGDSSSVNQPGSGYTLSAGFTPIFNRGSSSKGAAAVIDNTPGDATTPTLSGGTTNDCFVGVSLALIPLSTADTTAPTVPTGVTATANSATQVTVAWTASTDAVGVASYRIRRNGVDLTGATALTGTSFTDTTATPSTAYSYTVSAVDAAANRSAESSAASVTTPADTTAPSAPTGVTATAGSPTSVTVAWTSSTDNVGVASYRIRRGGIDLPGATAVTGTSFTDTTATAGTAYSYTVSAIDAAGNRSAESAVANVTTPAASASVSLVASTTTPMSGGVPVTITVPAGVTAAHLGLLILTTNNNSNAGASDFDAPGWTQRIENPAGQTNHEIFLATRLGLVAGNTFTVTSSLARTCSISVLWFDTQGRDVTTVGTPYTRAGVSGTTNAIPGIAGLGAGRQVLAVSTERTLTNGTAISGISPVTPTQHYFIEFASTTSNTHYVGSLSPTDAANTTTITYTTGSTNGFGVMLALAAPVGGGGDITPPSVPAGVTATANGPTSVTVGWTASSDNVGVASYRVRRNGVDLAGATALTTTVFTDTSVSASSIYSYTVSAVDAAGNRSAESSAASVTTPAPPDTTPPTVPGGVTATANSATQVTVAWTASTDNVGVASYRIQRDGVTLPAGAAVTGTSFADTSVTASTSYSYTVSAVDAAGNRSAESSSASATTPAVAATGAVASLTWSSLPSPTSLSLGWMVDAGTTVQAVASLAADLSSPILGTVTSRPASGWCNSRVTGLTPGTLYYTGVRVDGVLIATGRAQYKTLVSGLVASKVISSSCNITGSTHVVFTRIKAENPDFFCHQGDIHYADLTTYNDASWRSAFASSVRSSTFGPMLASVTMTYSPDNHDGPGTSQGGGLPAPWASAVSANVRELTGEVYQPTSQGLYRSYVHAGIRYVELDAWTFRSPSTDAQSPSKTMLGATQKAWFLDLIQTATEPAIVVFCHFPNYSNFVANGRWGDYTNERNEIGNAIAALTTAQRSKLIFIGGDSHAINADDGANAMWGRPSLNASPLNQSATGVTSGNWNIANIDVDNTRGYFSRLTWTPGVGIVTMTWDAVQDDGTVMATWTTSFNTDTSSPTTPTGLTAAAISSTQVNLSWSPSSDNVAVVGYRVRRNGVDLPGATALTSTSFADTTAVPSTAYSYTVSAVDAAGNRSPESTVANVLTPAPPPPPPPETMPAAPTAEPTPTAVIEPRAMAVTVYRGDYERVGNVPDYVSCSVTWQYLGVGAGQLVVGEDDPIASYLLEVGSDVVVPVVVDVGDTRWSGRVAKATLERNGPPGSGQITATLVDDWAWLQAMLASQNGANPGLTGMAQADARGGPAASVAADYINASAARLGVPVWASKPVQDISPTVALSARMDRLSDLLSSPLKAAGVTMAARVWLPGDPQPPGVTVALTSPTVVFAPQLLPEKPWLQWTDSMTNIEGLTFQASGAIAYRVILGLSGTDAARVYDQVIDTVRKLALGDFGFPEMYEDATDATLGAQSAAAGIEALMGTGGTVSASLTVADADPWVFGTDYVVGDVATIAVQGGVWRERVTRVTAKDDRERGLVFTPVMGEEDPEASGEDMMVQALARVAESLRALKTGR